MIFAAIPYLLAQGRAMITGALGDPIVRYLIIGLALIVAMFALKAHWQAGMVARADIEAATQAAQTDATATRAIIQQQRDASEQADAATLNQWAAQMEKVRDASETPNHDPVVLAGSDGWLRGKTGGDSR